MANATVYKSLTGVASWDESGFIPEVQFIVRHDENVDDILVYEKLIAHLEASKTALLEFRKTQEEQKKKETIRVKAADLLEELKSTDLASPRDFIRSLTYLTELP